MRAVIAVALLLVAAAPAPDGIGDFLLAERAAGLPQRWDRPVTIFAPTDAGFAALPDAVHERLLRPDNQALLRRVIGYHVVEGAWSIAALRQRIAAAGGAARLATVEGEPLTLRLSAGDIELTDVNGNTARIVAGDRRGPSGPIHRLDHVMVPRMDRDY